MKMIEAVAAVIECVENKTPFVISGPTRKCRLVIEEVVKRLDKRLSSVRFGVSGDLKFEDDKPSEKDFVVFDITKTPEFLRQSAYHLVTEDSPCIRCVTEVDDAWDVPTNFKRIVIESTKNDIKEFKKEIA